MAKKLISYDDTASGTGLPEVVEQRLNATYAPVDPYGYLDIWPEFIPSDHGITDLASFIAYMDTTLGSSAAKTQIGTSVGGEPIYTYTAGNPNAPHVFLNAGIHSTEVVGILAPSRWFQAFATSDDPSMVALRERVRVIYSPTSSPDQFWSSWKNDNDVNVNRNFPWNWKYAPTGEGSEPKGTAPLSEPEAQAIKDVLDNNPVGFVIDCHEANVNQPDMNYAAPTRNVHAHFQMFDGMAHRWAQANQTTVPSIFQNSEDQGPSLRNWAAHYLLAVKRRRNAAALLIEGKRTIAGSAWRELNRTGARWYCSFIQHAIITWLDHGQQEPPVMQRVFWTTQELNSSGSRTRSIVEPAGRQIDTADYTPIYWQRYAGAGPARNFLGVPLIFPGRYVIDWEATVVGASDTPATVRLRPGWGPMPTDGGDDIAQFESGAASATVDKWEVAHVSGRVFVTVTPSMLEASDTLYMAQLAARVSGVEQVAYLADHRGASLTVTAYPDDGWHFGTPLVLRP